MPQPAPATKNFAWSYSVLNNFEVCPRRYEQINLLKNIKEPPSEALDWGSRVHKALEKRVRFATPLPLGMEQLEPIANAIANHPGEKHTELKLAITRDFRPCDWMARNVFLRAVFDLINVADAEADIVDYKTGKITDDDTQLTIMSLVAMIHMPQLQLVNTAFLWLKDGAITQTTYTREEIPQMWNELAPRVEGLEAAIASSNFPPRPGGLCRKWCPVHTCEYHGG